MKKESPQKTGRQVLPAFLRACHGVDGASTVLLFGATLVLAMNFDAIGGCNAWRGVLIGASLLAAVMEKYYALRVRFDVRLFEAIAGSRLDLQSLDEELAGLFPQSTPASGRDWDARVGGAMILARRQLTTFTLQAILLAVASLSFAIC